MNRTENDLTMEVIASNITFTNSLDLFIKEDIRITTRFVVKANVMILLAAFDLIAIRKYAPSYLEDMYLSTYEYYMKKNYTNSIFNKKKQMVEIISKTNILAEKIISEDSDEDIKKYVSYFFYNLYIQREGSRTMHILGISDIPYLINAIKIEPNKMAYCHKIYDEEKLISSICELGKNNQNYIMEYYSNDE